jgi:O-antigen/teichoic acid export membrane protein
MSDTATLAQRSTAALGWTWVGALLRAAFQFGIQITLARLLGPHAFGQAAAVLLVINLGWLIAEGGFGAALIQRHELDELEVGRCLGGILVLSAAVAAAVVLLSRPLAAVLGDVGLQPFVIACAAIIPVQALANLPLSLLQRGLDAKRAQAIQLGCYVLAYGGLGVAMALAGWGAWSILAAAALHSALTLAGCWLSVRHTLRPRLPVLGSSGGYALRTTAANLVNWGLESVDRALISRLWGTAALGEYAVASNLVRAPVTLLMGAAQPVAFASASRLQSAHDRVARGYLAALAFGLSISAPVFVFLAWHASVMIDLLYGARWHGAAPLFTILCLGMPPFVMLALTGAMLRGLDAVASESRTQIVILALLAAGLWLAAGQPVTVAAALVSAATLVRAAALYRVLALHIGLSMLAWLRAARAGVVFSGVVILVSELVAAAGPARAALFAALLGGLLCLMLLRLSHGALLGEELVQMLRNRGQDSPTLARLCLWVGLPNHQPI